MGSITEKCSKCIQLFRAPEQHPYSPITQNFIKETRDQELLQNKQKKCLSQLFTLPYPADKVNERN